jgi:hypothetical protein
MFSLHERTQRKICRIAFVLICAVPTLITLCWAAYFHRPWHERDWQRTLESELHVRVEVGEVSAPRPLQRFIEHVKLSDLQSARPMIELQALQIGTANSTSVETVTINCDQLHQIAHAAQIWLGSVNSCDSKWQLKELNFTSAEGAAWKLKDVRCEIKAVPNGIRQCLVHAKCDSRLIRLSIERDIAGKVQTIVDAQQVLMPAWLLASMLPGASRWQQATVTGVINLEAENSEVYGKFRGHVDSIDMHSWMGNDLLQATATLQLDNLTWQGERLESAQGSLQTEAGKISNAFLLLLKEKFLCTLAVEESRLSDKSQLQQIDRLGCQFLLNEAGLALSGMFAWGEINKGCIITSADKPLVSIPAMPTLPLAQFVQLVSPYNPYGVPATREAINLSEKLPLPESSSTKK